MADLSAAQQAVNALGLRTTADAPVQQEDESQQANFLLLMTEQIKNQNPLNPLEGKDFLAQLAQFSVVEELTRLNSGFSDLSQSVLGNQSLQAASLLGKYARVDSNSAYLTADRPLAGSAELPLPANNVRVNYYSEGGELAHSDDLGSRNAGTLEFNWNGFNTNGDQLPEGYYRIEVLADMGTGTQALSTQMDAAIESVSMGGSGGLQVNLRGVGEVPLSSIKSLRVGS